MQANVLFSGIDVWSWSIHVILSRCHWTYWKFDVLASRTSKWAFRLPSEPVPMSVDPGDAEVDVGSCECMSVWEFQGHLEIAATPNLRIL